MTTARKRSPKTRSADTTVTDYKLEYWKMADALRGSMDAAEYKHVVLGLVFLKYISDAFEEAYAKLEREKDEGADPEYPDEYRAQSIFWVPPEARWRYLRNQTRQPTIGRLVDDAMTAIERDNRVLRDVLPKDYAPPALDKVRLGQVIDLVSNVNVGAPRPGPRTCSVTSMSIFWNSSHSQKAGRVANSTLLGPWFATCRNAGALQRPGLRPLAAGHRACSSSRMSSFEHTPAATGTGARLKAISPSTAKSPTTPQWRMAKMNLAIRGIDGLIEHGDSFHNDRHPDLRADFILANPPFNVSDWGGERLRDDKRWEHGVPPVGNANFAWVQHFLYHLAPRGTAGFVLSNGSMSFESVQRGRDPEEHNRGGAGGLHRRVAGAVVPVDADTCLPLVSVPRPERRRTPGRDPLHRRPPDGLYA